MSRSSARTSRPRSTASKITGGNHDGFPNNLDQITGALNGPTAPVTMQGGGIYVNAQAHSLQITDDVIHGNSGAYGGGIRVGTPESGPTPNDNIRIAYNRITRTAGRTSPAASASSPAHQLPDRPQHDLRQLLRGVRRRDQPLRPLERRQIDHNRIWFNRSYDEGGAVMVAGELPANPTTLPPGSGAVGIHDNVIQANLANDDGGGIRLLMVDGRRRSQTGQTHIGTVLRRPINIINNTIANNISTHEGGGIALDDATNVVVANNTVMKNIDHRHGRHQQRQAGAGRALDRGQQRPAAGRLDKRYGVNARALFSKPTLFDNVFRDNRAGCGRQRTGSTASADRGPEPDQPLGHRPGRRPRCRVGQRRRCLTPAAQPVRHLGAQHGQRDDAREQPRQHPGELHRRHLPRRRSNVLPWRGYPRSGAC